MPDDTYSKIPAGLPALYPAPDSEGPAADPFNAETLNQLLGDDTEEAPAPIETSWSWHGATTAGAGHLQHDLENQDAFEALLLKGGYARELLVLTVADGAGSAEYAVEGAQACVKAFNAAIHQAVVDGATVETLDPEQLLLQVQAAMAATAEDRPLREYACTFTAAVLGLEQTLLMQIGDGFIVMQPEHLEGEDPRPLELGLTPQQDEFVNTTSFVSTSTAADLMVRRVPTPHAIVLSSDGLYRLAVKVSTQEPHPAFYPRLFDAAVTPGFDIAACEALERHLTSDAIQTRTDDDVTLLVARRLHR